MEFYPVYKLNTVPHLLVMHSKHLGEYFGQVYYGILPCIYAKQSPHLLLRHSKNMFECFVWIPNVTHVTTTTTILHLLCRGGVAAQQGENIKKGGHAEQQIKEKKWIFYVCTMYQPLLPPCPPHLFVFALMAQWRKMGDKRPPL